MKNMKRTHRIASSLRRAVIAAVCLAAIYGLPAMAHADSLSWLRRWWVF